MKILNKKPIIIAALTAIITACVTLLIAINASTGVLAADISFGDEKISPTYTLGEVLTPPTAKIVYGGNEYDAELSSIVYPNNKAYKEDSFVLSVPGKYTANFKATASGKVLTSSVSFIVSGSAYEVSGSNSSVYYGSMTKTDEQGSALTGEGSTVNGLVVSLAAGDTFTYKIPIDLKNKTKADNLLSLYAMPQIMGKADARILKVRLTDAYDKNNYVDVVTYGNYGDEDEVKQQALYSGAGANGQLLTGLHFYASPNTRTFTYQGALYTLNKNIVYNSANGYPSFAFSLAAVNGYGKGIRNNLSGAYTLSMNYAEKQLFGCETIASSSNGMIIDLDDPMFFDNLWTGFKTGEAYISIWAENYVNSSFNFIINNLADNDLTNAHYFDQDAPLIDVDLPEGSVPAAIVNEEYSVFNAVATDAVDGKVDTGVMVYRNYYSSNPSAVDVIDGKFTPNKAGVYTIVYKAEDSSGKVATKKVDVTVKEQSMLSINLGDADQTSAAGVTVSLKKPTVTGADGSYSLKVTATKGGESLTILPDNDGNYSFVPMSSGDYIIKYVCKDYNVTKEVEYSITVTANSVPTIIDEAYLPPVFVKGWKYTLPVLNGYDFSDGTAKDKSTTISYSFDNGQSFTEYQAGSTFTVGDTDSVTVKYSVGQDEISNKVYSVPVTDVSGVIDDIPVNILRSKYFYGTAFTAKANVEEENVEYSTFEENARLTFVNKLLTTDFSLSFSVKNFAAEKLVITLTDAENKDCALVLSVRLKDQGSCYVSVDGGEEQILSVPLTGSAFKLLYNQKVNAVKFGDVSFPLSTFKGFDSKTAYLTIDVLENTSLTTVTVSEINGQPINAADGDNAGPRYYIEVNNDEKAVGEKLIVSEFIAADVLRANATVTLTITDEEGNVVQTDDGISMLNVTDFSRDYIITLNKTGEYSITGKCLDGGRGVTNVSLSVYVKDSVAPVITLNNAATVGVVGSNVVVARYTVTDQTDSTLDVTVSVQRPDLKVEEVKNFVFKADIKGVYTVTYFATDAAGNCAFTSYDIVVK